MPMCEKCWGDAYLRAYGSSKGQSECYQELLKERKDNPCTPKQQAGQWWDEERQIDTRLLCYKCEIKLTKENISKNILYCKSCFKRIKE